MDGIMVNLFRSLGTWDCARAADQHFNMLGNLLSISLHHKEAMGPVASSIYYIASRIILIFHGISHIQMPCIDLVCYLLETHMATILQDLGRDFIRTLQNISSYSRLDVFWRNMDDIIKQHQDCNPFDLRPPSRRVLAMRLSPEMESNIIFLLEHVKVGSQKPYQSWYVEWHLMNETRSAIREILIPDIIRFICCVIHPSNSVLASDILPRWMVLGWLLKLTKV